MRKQSTGVGHLVFEHIDFSSRGRARVVLWTVLGTIGCIAFALLFDSFNFDSFNSSQRLRMVVTDIVVPTLLAAPLLYFFSSKLRELAIAHHRLAIHASTDSLTAVLNREAFTTLVDAYLTQVREHERGVTGALLVIDVDHFKRINDSFGHDRGDEALRLIAQTIKGALRAVDLVGRIGGEEFGVFLPGTTPVRAQVAAERIRTAIAEAEFAPDGTRSELSVSVGGATFDHSVPFRTLYRAADKRLYEAKESGRNGVAVSAVDAGPEQAAA
jgi:diguanylate cyclase